MESGSSVREISRWFLIVLNGQLTTSIVTLTDSGCRILVLFANVI